MIAHNKQIRRRPTPPAWHAGFLTMLPTIGTHARIAFRHLDPEAREEALQEVIANACRAYVRLVELGKADNCASEYREEVCLLAARQKLNVAFVNGALIIAAVAGVVFKSWAAFVVTSVVLIGGAIYCGDVRPGPRRR